MLVTTENRGPLPIHAESGSDRIWDHGIGLLSLKICHVIVSLSCLVFPSNDKLSIVGVFSQVLSRVFPDL